jgi:hypothetical protein
MGLVAKRVNVDARRVVVGDLWSRCDFDGGLDGGRGSRGE